MPKEAVFKVKLEPDLPEAFMHEAQASHRQAREYDDFLASKVHTARASMQAGVGIANDDVEAQFAARRAQVAGRV